MGSVEWFKSSIACVLVMLLCIRVSKKRGKLRALFYFAVMMVLLLYTFSPSLVESFILRALFRLLG